tara:strand:+ start:125 stop:907 length:783 start_codon:yes stop_codon:yes gene_type:complete
MNSNWSLPEHDLWSTPFAKTLLSQLELFQGASILDIAGGGGIPAFYLAEQVGSHGQVLSIDINPRQILQARTTQGMSLPWLKFEVGDMKKLPKTLPQFDIITGNLSFMFFRPNRPAVLRQVISRLKPGGQIVLTFPSLGTFESLFNKVNKEMTYSGLKKERAALVEYITERPSANQALKWLKNLGMEVPKTTEWPLEVKIEPGKKFLEHPLLRRGFLEDIYECFDDQRVAEKFMKVISESLSDFQPLIALRCVMSGRAPK